MGFSKKEDILLLVLAFLVLSGAGFRLWMREGDIVVEVLEQETSSSGTLATTGSLPELQADTSVSPPISTVTTTSPELAAAPREREQSAGEVPMVDINEASAQELQVLPGIGPALAQRIIADRNQFGRYRRVEDLARVRGIGRETVEKLRPFVVIR